MPEFECAAAVHPLDPDVTVQVEGSMPPLPAELDAEVETEWQAALLRMERVMRLFNGAVFNAVRITPTRITGHFTEYRRVVAQMARPALFKELRIRSLAACGVLTCRDGVVFGRRQHGAAYQSDLWQLPPAGSVDAACIAADGTVDVRRQVLTELQEELSIPDDCVQVGAPLCIVEHQGSRVSDLGVRLHTDLSAADILCLHKTHGNAEYTELRVVPASELEAFLSRHRGWVVPSAPILLQAAQLVHALSTAV